MKLDLDSSDSGDIVTFWGEDPWIIHPPKRIFFLGAWMCYHLKNGREGTIHIRSTFYKIQTVYIYILYIYLYSAYIHIIRET